MIKQSLDMTKEEYDLYRELQVHLDKLPIGFPETNSGVELNVLRHFFTTEEAKIALKLKYSFKNLDQIHDSVKELDISKEKLEEMLDTMFKKGSIRLKKEDGKKLYATDIFVVGMHEAKVNHLTKEYLTDFNQYIDEGFNIEFIGTRMSQMRTIPIEKSITPEHHIPTYEEVAKIIEDIDGPIMLVNCICRQANDLLGEPCKQTSLRENCMGFGHEVQPVIDIGRGREINKEEALEILRKNQEDGLVLQAGNSLKPDFICSCCSCCCGALSGLRDLPRPVDFFATNYYAESDPELCTGCETCVERCQMNAIKIKNEVSRVLRKRCIGCGNCVAVCPEEAMQLHKKEKETIPPQTSEELYEEILRRKQAIKSK